MRITAFGATYSRSPREYVNTKQSDTILLLLVCIKRKITKKNQNLMTNQNDTGVYLQVLAGDDHPTPLMTLSPNHSPAKDKLDK